MDFKLCVSIPIEPVVQIDVIFRNDPLGINERLSPMTLYSLKYKSLISS